MINLKRVYDPISPEDGKRVLIDRLWPRGIAKNQATWHLWLKDVAPSNELRKWFSHQPEKFELFKQRYEQELTTDPAKREAVKLLLQDASNGNITLLSASKNVTINHAVVLRDWIFSFSDK